MYYQNRKHSITYLQINDFNSERFLKTTERAQIEIDESANVDTETTIYIIKVSVNQKVLATIYTCPDCNNEVTPGHEDLLRCTCGLRFVKDSCIVNDKVKKWKIDQSQLNSNSRIIMFMLWATRNNQTICQINFNHNN